MLLVSPNKEKKRQNFERDKITTITIKQQRIITNTTAIMIDNTILIRNPNFHSTLVYILERITLNDTIKKASQF